MSNKQAQSPMTNVLLRMREWAISQWEDSEMKTEAELKVIHTATSQGSQEMVEHPPPRGLEGQKETLSSSFQKEQGPTGTLTDSDIWLPGESTFVILMDDKVIH